MLQEDANVAEDAPVQEGVPKAVKSKKAPAKTPKVSNEALTGFKAQLRKKLNDLEDKALAKTAKNFGVQTSKYKGMNPGLVKMNTVNSIVGSAARAIRKEGRPQKEMFSLIASA